LTVQRSLGKGEDRSVSLGEEGAADSWRVAGGIRTDMVEEACSGWLQGCAEGGLEPAFDWDYPDLDWITPKSKSTRAQRVLLPPRG
jgi:hypothetical protein